MANSLFITPTDQNSSGNPNEPMRNTHLVNPSGEIRTEPPQKRRGRKPGSKTGQPKQKKECRRGMGVARLERLRIEEERRNMFFVAQGGGVSPNGTRSPDPGVVLQGFPSYGTGGPNMSVGGYTRSRFPCGGSGSGQIPPWGFVETVPVNAANNQWDAWFKLKQRIDGDQNVVRSNGGGFSKYTTVPHLLPPDQRSQGFFYDHGIARCSAPPTASFNQGLTEEPGSGSPRNGTREVKEYQFFPGNDGDKSVSSVSTSVGDCSPDTSTIDLSLKL